MIDPAVVLDNLRFVKAAKYTKGRKSAITVIGIHTPETGESDTTAEAVANYFASQNAGGSTHIVVDNNSTVRCVADSDTAWGGAGANSNGVHIEIAGRAGQTAAQWADAYSQAAIRRASLVVAAWCKRYAIPASRLSAAQIKAGQSGIVGHNEISEAFKKSTHWDPGPHFPWTQFLALVNAQLTDTQENAMLSTKYKCTAPPSPRGLEDDRYGKGREYFYGTDGNSVYGWNGAPLKGGHKIGDLHVIDLPKGHKPIVGIKCRDKNLVIYAEDGATFKYDYK